MINRAMIYRGYWKVLGFCAFAFSMKIDKWAPYVSGMILHRIRVFLLRTHPMPLPANAAINQNRKSNQPISSAKLFKSGNLSRKFKYLRHFNTGSIAFLSQRIMKENCRFNPM